MIIQLFEKFVFSRPIKKVMSLDKYKHSKRVATLSKELSSSHDVYNSALYHDFLERGGTEETSKKVLSFYSYQLVDALSHDKNKSTLKTLKNKLKDKEQHFINDVIIIKLCDRTDNLVTKYNEGKLKNKYINKSVELIKYLYENYVGDKTLIREFINKNIIQNIPKIKDSLILN